MTYEENEIVLLNETLSQQIEQEKQMAQLKRQNLLERLGLTEEEAKLLLS